MTDIEAMPLDDGEDGIPDDWITVYLPRDPVASFVETPIAPRPEDLAPANNPDSVRRIGQTSLDHAPLSLDGAKEKTALDLKPDPDLSPKHQNCERILLVALKQPTRSSDSVKKLLKLSSGHYLEAIKELEEAGLAEMMTSPGGRVSASSASIEPKRIIRNYTKKYITPRVLATLAEQDDSPFVQELLQRKRRSIERQADKPTGEAIFAGLKPPARQPKVAKGFDGADRYLCFKVIMNESLFIEDYGVQQFAGFDPRIKVLLGAWVASGFAKTADEFNKTVATITNKKVSQDSQLSPEEIHDVLQDFAANGYCQNGSWRYGLTPKAVTLLKNYDHYIKKDLSKKIRKL